MKNSNVLGEDFLQYWEIRKKLIKSSLELVW